MTLNTRIFLAGDAGLGLNGKSLAREADFVARACADSARAQHAMDRSVCRLKQHLAKDGEAPGGRTPRLHFIRDRSERSQEPATLRAGVAAAVARSREMALETGRAEPVIATRSASATGEAEAATVVPFRPAAD
jgi:hypothetical protein